MRCWIDSRASHLIGIFPPSALCMHNNDITIERCIKMTSQSTFHQKLTSRINLKMTAKQVSWNSSVLLSSQIRWWSITKKIFGICERPRNSIPGTRPRVSCFAHTQAGGKPPTVRPSGELRLTSPLCVRCCFNLTSRSDNVRHAFERILTKHNKWH